MTFDLISGLHMQIQTWHLPLRLCIHAKYYVKSGLTNVLKNANKTKNMQLFSIWIANYSTERLISQIFPQSIGYLEKTLKIFLPGNKMPQSSDNWYVTSPSCTLPSLLKLWLCGQNGLILDVTEFTLTYKLKHTESPGLTPLGLDP